MWVTRHVRNPRFQADMASSIQIPLWHQARRKDHTEHEGPPEHLFIGMAFLSRRLQTHPHAESDALPHGGPPDLSAKADELVRLFDDWDFKGILYTP